MTELEVRVSRIEAVQHFELAMIGAVSKVVKDHPGYAQYVRENLETHYAILIAESSDEVKLNAFEELKNQILAS